MNRRSWLELVGAAVGFTLAGTAAAAEDTRPSGPAAAIAEQAEALPGPAAFALGREREEHYRRSSTYFQLGLSSQQRGDLASAREHYLAALAEDPAFVEALVNLARVECDRGEADRARTLLAEAEAMRPEYPPIYAARGVLLLRAGESGRAVDELRRALAFDPYSVETLSNLGTALASQGLRADARKALEQALRIDPDHAAGALNLGLLQDQDGDWIGALIHYRHFLQVTGPQDPGRVEVARRVDMLNARVARERRAPASDGSSEGTLPVRRMEKKDDR